MLRIKFFYLFFSCFPFFIVLPAAAYSVWSSVKPNSGVEMNNFTHICGQNSVSSDLQMGWGGPFGPDQQINSLRVMFSVLFNRHLGFSLFVHALHQTAMILYNIFLYQRVLVYLQRTRLSWRRMIWLLPHPLRLLLSVLITALAAVLQIPRCPRMLVLKPGLLRLRHWLSDALTSRLDLIQRD